MIVWFRLYGNDGEPMDFDEVASAVSCDPIQARLIYETELQKSEDGT